MTTMHADPSQWRTGVIGLIGLIGLSGLVGHDEAGCLPASTEPQGTDQ